MLLPLFQLQNSGLIMRGAKDVKPLPVNEGRRIKELLVVLSIWGPIPSKIISIVLFVAIAFPVVIGILLSFSCEILTQSSFETREGISLVRILCPFSLALNWPVFFAIKRCIMRLLLQ